LSLNRFEGKKNVALAIEAFARLNNDAIVDEETFGNLRLVLAGGFDTSVQDNVQTLARLKSLCRSYGLSSFVLSELSLKAPPADTQVFFVQNFSDLQRRALLTSPSTIALLYTPSNEHFGIVPTEAMACGLPVLATNTGGPIETVVDRSEAKSDEVGTGLLRAPEGPKWADALAQLVMMKNSDRQAMGEEGKRRVKELFALERMGEKLDRACRTAEEMGAVGLDEGRLLLVGAALAAVAAGLYYAVVPSLLG
jgi:alpha-1,3/alpha-1,6-mannosyltransferase